MQCKTIRGVFAVVLTGFLLAGCSMADKLAPGRGKVDYKKSKAIDNLEVPPELSSSTINEAPDTLDTAGTTLSEFGTTGPARDTGTVMPANPDMRVVRDGDQQWLVVKGSPAQVWPRVREFWLQEGFLLRLEDPRLGILETGWNENRADIPQGVIRSMIGKVLDSAYSAATRDKFRVRLERGAEAGTTEIYLTHRGVQEVVKGGVDAASVWEPRPSDPELEAEMLKRLLVFLGAEQQKAQTLVTQQETKAARAELVSEAGGAMLIIKEDYSRAWRRTGVALDRVGFTVQDRDRSGGTYYVKYNDPLAEQNRKGVLSKLAFWSSDDEEAGDEYRIELQAEGAETHVIVRNSKGERDTGATAKRILTLLEEQLR